MDFQISLYLDQRRSKAGSTGKVYPVKLRVWNRVTRTQKLYPTSFDLSESEFKGAWESQKPRKEYQILRAKLEIIIQKAKEAANELLNFNFDDFERKLYRRKGDGVNLLFHYREAIEAYVKHGQIGTSSNYDLSLKSILTYEKYRSNIPKEKEIKTISFYEITVDWLKGYESFMIKNNKRSYATVGIYLRPLRAIFNKALEENEIKSDVYPFGKKKYQIPASENVKKALSKEQLKVLYNTVPKTPEQEKAKAFWFFSYSCNGMNIKDIALLRFQDIENGALTFHRAKTINTTKSKLKRITAYLNDYTKGVIDRYGNKDKRPDNLIFKIVGQTSTASKQKQEIGNFTRFVNQHLKKLCLDNQLPEISSYWARHTFATNSIRNGASMEFMQESLGHGDLKTTLNYFAGFEDDTKKEFAKKLMDF